MSSIETLGEALQDCMLDIAESIIDAVNNDPRHKKVDLNKIAKNANKNLSTKGYNFFSLEATSRKELEIVVHEEEEYPDDGQDPDRD